MTEDLRALMRAELNDERPPPLGDVVGAALREGRRVRRRRRRLVSVSAGSAGVLALVLAGGVAASSEPRRPSGSVALSSPQVAASPVPPALAAPEPTVSPGSVPLGPSAPATDPPGRTLAIHSGVDQAAGKREKATTGAMLYLLTQLLPPGRTSHAAVSASGDPHVQITLDRGKLPGLLRLRLGQKPVTVPRPARGGTAKVSILRDEDNCMQDTVVVAQWPDGTAVRLDIASCPLDGKPGSPVLTADEAATIAADPRWGTTMDAALVRTGGKAYGDAPVFAE